MMGLYNKSFLARKAMEQKVRKLWIFVIDQEKGNIHDYLI